jgi:hypothetical protein
MKPSTQIRTTRKLIFAAILAGLVLAGLGLFVGANIPGLVASTVGWVVVIMGIVWLVTSQRQRPSGASPANSWRPGDEDTQV